MKILIVGSGLYGATVASCLADHDVTVLESRDVVGGNVSSHFDEQIQCHVSDYGAHIFHTNSDKVWEFINKFSAFNGYKHFVNATTADGDVIRLPFGMSMFSKLLGLNTPESAKSYFDSLPKVHGDSVESWCLSNIGPVLYENVVKNYTEKQWGRPCNQLPADIIRRLPKRFDWDTTYFNNAKYQGMPVDGYTAIVSRMLSGAQLHLGVSVDLITLDDLHSRYDHVFFSGELDRLFGYSLGVLPYRGLRFSHDVYKSPKYLTAPVVNDLSKSAFTRKIEHRQFYPESVGLNNTTLVTTEFPTGWAPGDIPFYPVRDQKSAKLHQTYTELATSRFPNLVLGGRLGSFQYFDMDQVIAMAMHDTKRIHT